MLKRRSVYRCKWMVAAVLLGLSVAAAPKGFNVGVNDVSGLDSPWPMLGGLPFPEGELSDPSQIRIVDAQGEEVPAQIDVVATWRDGSIRWALAGVNASPQGEYRVEYGPEVSRSAPERPLTVSEAPDGALIVDTIAAVYEFLPDRLLPESGRMGDTVFLAESGDGAYLIDNRGRLARVAGAGAEIETQVVKQGPIRTVIRRSGWYVTSAGDRVARAKVWFYFTAGSPFVRITHTIVFTEDTNDLWLRDYGLEFRSQEPAQEAVFVLSEATWTDRHARNNHKAISEDKEKRRELAEMFSSGLVERQQMLFSVDVGDGETYMLQENYPHVVEREFQAVVAQAPSPLLMDQQVTDESDFWVHPWHQEFEVAGDWAEARHDDHALTVVMPQLAQRFPKEIAIGPQGVRVALWSGRSGRDLDFRAVTLVNEYWKTWANHARSPFGLQHRGPDVATRVAKLPSNAQCAARTHDIWLLPRIGNLGDEALKARALAASHPPLLLADPAWMGNSMAFGWPFHPKDTARFPEAEANISDHWEQVLAGLPGNGDLRRAGFLMWGMNMTIGDGVRWFRLSQGIAQYRMDFVSWGLFARSGERRYLDYARHFTRFSGDLGVHHWDAGRRFRGGHPDAEVHLPFFWQGNSEVGLGNCWAQGWWMNYRLTGDEYARELLEMVADGYRQHADLSTTLPGMKQFNHLYNLSPIYELTQDETIRKLAKLAADELINLENPTGLNDDLRYGVYYKPGTEWLVPLYLYYNATGDETAREAILRAMDNKFRFFYSSNQTFRLFLFAEAYRWTGYTPYLSLTKLMVDEPFYSLMGHNYLFGAPTALHAIAHAPQPIEPFPVLAATRLPETDETKDESVVRSAHTGHIMPHTFIEADTLPPILLTKQPNKPVSLSIYVCLPGELAEDTEPVVTVRRLGADGDAPVREVIIRKEQRFKTKRTDRWYPHRWHVYLDLPATLEAGRYSVECPDAVTIVVLDSDADSVSLADMN